jgi:hypothetical protein
MALNLSRNTKVFISSVNGVPTEGGQFLTGYVSAGGANYVEGDRLKFNGGSGADFSAIAHTVSSGAITKVAINGNGIGKSITDSDEMTELTAHTTAGVASSGSGCTVEVVTSGSTTAVTSEGSRIATGRFIGNGNAANTFRVGVLDGYSFSQGSESTDVTISEAGATPSRGSKRFNDALPPAEWSFGTYVRPFIHGADSWRVVNSYDMCENILWNALAGTAITSASGAGVTCEAEATAASVTTGGNVQFDSSNKHELLKLNLYFVLENTTYRLNDAQISSAEIDFSIDGIAQITWSGNATTIDQVTTATEDPYRYLVIGNNSNLSLTTSVASTDVDDTFTESYTFADSTGPSDADYLRNKLSALYLDTNLQGGGSGSSGLDARTYAVNITGGSITIENNVTYVTPETIGIVDKPIGSFTGARTISGSLTMYLDTKADGSNQLLSDLAGATDLVSNSFDMSLLMGSAYASSRPVADRYNTTTMTSANEAHDAGDFTGPAVEFFMPKCHLSVPAIEVGDLVSVSLEFSAQGDTLLTTDEMSVKYMGTTTHSDSRGYDHNTTANINVAVGG